MGGVVIVDDSEVRVLVEDQDMVDEASEDDGGRLLWLTLATMMPSSAVDVTDGLAAVYEKVGLTAVVVRGVADS